MKQKQCLWDGLDECKVAEVSERRIDGEYAGTWCDAHWSTHPDRWRSGGVDRSGLAAYTHLIRSTDDPVRLTREERKGKETAWRSDMKRSSQPAWQKRIVEVLDDGKPRTFNAICLDASGGEHCADSAYQMAPDLALWHLVEVGVIEHTMEAPILFRLRDEEEADEDEEEEEDGGICGGCNGSGEGRYDGSTCGSCGGSGEWKAGRDDDYEPDYDAMRDDLMERDQLAAEWEAEVEWESPE